MLWIDLRGQCTTVYDMIIKFNQTKMGKWASEISVSERKVVIDKNCQFQNPDSR